MKSPTLCFIFVICSVLLNAQTDSFAINSNIENTPIFTFVEQNPEFPGGVAALLKFLQQNIKYPQMERDNNIQGKVLLRFIVTEDGKIDSIQVIRSVSRGLDKEAIRVVKMLPNFKPGTQQGKPVRVYFHLPIVFKLQDNNLTEEDIIQEKINLDENFRNACGQYQFQKWDDAIRYFKKSIILFPNDYLSYEFKAECELHINKKKEACKDYKQAQRNGSPTASESIKKNCE